MCCYCSSSNLLGKMAFLLAADTLAMLKHKYLLGWGTDSGGLPEDQQGNSTTKETMASLVPLTEIMGHTTLQAEQTGL